MATVAINQLKRVEKHFKDTCFQEAKEKMAHYLEKVRLLLIFFSFKPKQLIPKLSCNTK